MKTKVFGREVEVDQDWRCRPRGPVDKDRAPAVTRSGVRVSAEAWQIMMQLRRARIASGLTQAELARRVGFGQARVADYEAGRFEPSIGKVVRLAKALGMTELAL